MYIYFFFFKAVPGTTDVLQRYSEVLTNAFMALQYCPFQNTVPLALQTCLSMSQKILDTLESLEKKELTYEKISTTVSIKGRHKE